MLELDSLVEVTELEDLFSHELECDLKVHPEHPECTIKAVVRVYSCKEPPAHWCQRRLNDFHSLVASVGGRCDGCGKSAVDCWRIIPI